MAASADVCSGGRAMTASGCEAAALPRGCLDKRRAEGRCPRRYGPPRQPAAGGGGGCDDGGWWLRLESRGGRIDGWRRCARVGQGRGAGRAESPPSVSWEGRGALESAMAAATKHPGKATHDGTEVGEAGLPTGTSGAYGGRAVSSWVVDDEATHADAGCAAAKVGTSAVTAVY